jgi:uncharacterized protein YciI
LNLEVVEREGEPRPEALEHVHALTVPRGTATGPKPQQPPRSLPAERTIHGHERNEGERRVIVYHVAVTTVDDYLAKREPHRRAHIERLIGLRAGGAVIGGGPAADGRSADIFYRLQQPSQLERVVEEDPYRIGGVWATWTWRSFTGFVEPWEQPPVVLDGSRRVTIVEGRALDPDMAEFALIEMRGAGRIAFGGFFDAGATLAVARTADAEEARGWFVSTGFWDDRLTTRALLHVL